MICVGRGVKETKIGSVYMHILYMYIKTLKYIK